MKKWKDILLIGAMVSCLLLLMYWIIVPTNSKFDIDFTDYIVVEEVFAMKLPEGAVIKEMVEYGGLDKIIFVKLTIESDKLDEFCSNASIDMTKLNEKAEGPIVNWWEMGPKEFAFEYKHNSKYFVFSKPKGGVITILMSNRLASDP